jgi:hypothetical protein
MATSYMQMVTLTGNQFLNEREVWMGARGCGEGSRDRHWMAGLKSRSPRIHLARFVR